MEGNGSNHGKMDYFGVENKKNTYILGFYKKIREFLFTFSENVLYYIYEEISLHTYMLILLNTLRFCMHFGEQKPIEIGRIYESKKFLTK